MVSSCHPATSGTRVRHRASSTVHSEVERPLTARAVSPPSVHEGYGSHRESRAATPGLGRNQSTSTTMMVERPGRHLSSVLQSRLFREARWSPARADVAGPSDELPLQVRDVGLALVLDTSGAVACSVSGFGSWWQRSRVEAHYTLAPRPREKRDGDFCRQSVLRWTEGAQHRLCHHCRSTRGMGPPTHLVMARADWHGSSGS